MPLLGIDLGTTNTVVTVDRQIRNIYGMVKAFESRRPRDYDQLKLLIPKLHYAAARESKLKPLVEALTAALFEATNLNRGSLWVWPPRGRDSTS